MRGDEGGCVVIRGMCPVNFVTKPYLHKIS